MQALNTIQKKALQRMANLAFDWGDDSIRIIGILVLLPSETRLEIYEIVRILDPLLENEELKNIKKRRKLTIHETITRINEIAYQYQQQQREEEREN